MLFILTKDSQFYGLEVSYGILAVLFKQEDGNFF